MIEALQNAFRLPDLRRKMLYTALILIVYQFAAHVTVPGVDRTVLDNLFNSDESGFLSVLNLLSGGAVSNFSVIANGVYPYITASIILQLLVPIIPALEQLSKEPGGMEKINGQYTYYLAIPMAALQSIGQINIFQSQIDQVQGGTLIPGFGFGAGSDLLTTLSVIVTMTAGTMFAIWLGELITEQGIGNGISIIIFAGIVARVPSNLYSLLETHFIFNLLAFVLLTIVTVVVIVVIQEGTRRIPVQYGKRVRGRKMYGGGTTHIPLKVNTAGMIPLIFAQSIVTFPAIIAGFFSGSAAVKIQDIFGNQQGFIYWFLYFWLVVGFTYFYTGVMIQNQNLGENLQKNGGFIPGIRPGRRTQEYINRIVNRITLVGAVFLGAVAILPGIMRVVQTLVLGQAATNRNPALVISSAGLIIVVGVVIDTMRQLEAQLMMRNYDGFMR
ncbi:MAG TPA: preprotein translocase subunit SecY [Aggregatilinea sp.]|jgi:preprotein translocase subunit SecY|uniref:preprotein translocase subunit SecY n=1 Tax=Aggregatilinea sp. TaxID=2806333 RepID=UPI002C6C9C69|nr:preprotein translocase subunit SecY [Aggregatilinea sp.]HML22142.1 preprotein translocase subunit SecY [Aggregatilinea sp.]